MKTTRTIPTIFALFAVLGSHAMASPDASLDARALNARWAEQAFSARPLAEQGGPVVGIPFSFVYDGKPSAALLPQWRAEQEEEAVDATTRRRTLTFTDPQTGLEVKAVANIYLDTPGVDWTVYFTNTGTSDTPILEKVRAVDVTINPPVSGIRPKGEGLVQGADPVLRRLRGTKIEGKENLADFTPLEDPLPVGTKLEWGPPGAAPSWEAFPFFTLDWGGGGVVTALGWTGHWQADIDRTGNPIRLAAGMRNLHLKLKPGETIRSPRVLQVYWNGGDPFTGDNLFRRTMLAHILPQRDGKPVFPPFAYATSTSEMSNTTEANERSYMESFKNLGFEYYWLDAWWIKGGHPNGIGHWGFPISRGYDPVRFPNGIKPLSDLAHGYGMKFLQWFQPEEVYPNTDLALEHPEWLLKSGSKTMVDLGNPVAREYMTRYLNAVIKEWGIDWWRTDGGPDLEHWKSGDTDPDRIGMTEIRYVEGYYQMWDGMRRANPQLMLDNCAGGGQRLDLETSARSLPLWVTDSAGIVLGRKDLLNAAIQNQAIHHGLNRYLPFSEAGTMGADPYYFRSGFNGGITFCEDTRPEGYPRELLAQGIAEGKRLRKYLLGDFYPLSEPSLSARDWCLFQYHRPAEADGVVFAFRRHESPDAIHACGLREIEPSATYEVTQFISYSGETKKTMTGAELLKTNMEIQEKPGSAIMEYRRVR
jgi:alpha-galactosidase